MFRRNRKVKPEKEQHRNNADERDVESSDNETLTTLAYTLRNIRKSVISELCDTTEIEHIEERFLDTSRVIFKELDHINRSLLMRSYRRPFRSDLIAVGDLRVTSPPSQSLMHHDNGIAICITDGGRNNITTRLPIMEEIWNPSEHPTSNTKIARGHSQRRVVNNAVSSEVPRRPPKSGMCRIT